MIPLLIPQHTVTAHATDYTVRPRAYEQMVNGPERGPAFTYASRSYALPSAQRL